MPSQTSEYPYAVQPSDLRVLAAAEVADLLSVSIPVLDRWRANGDGPPWIRLSARRVGYPMRDLHAWIAARPTGRKPAADSLHGATTNHGTTDDAI